MTMTLPKMIWKLYSNSYSVQAPVVQGKLRNQEEEAAEAMSR